MMRDSIDRRFFIKTGAILGASSVLTGSAHAAELKATPPETEGPFYPTVAQKDKDFDLTKVAGRDGVAKGTAIIVEGSVVDTNGKPVEDVTVDLWQANAAGRYAHPHDKNPAPLDPDFQGWAIVQSGKKGGFRFKTIIPGAYKVSGRWSRPPHIHFKISKRGYKELTTQMYFPGEPLNDKDRLLGRMSKDEQAQLISEKVEGGELDTYRFRIVIAEV